MPENTFPGPPPQEALDWFRAKNLKIGFDHRDVWREEHAAMFTVAKAMEIDLLADIRQSVDAALAQGQTFAQFRQELIPLLQRRGWWGVQEMADPQTGEVREVRLGSPRRLRTIYRTNLRTARAAGQWERIERTKQLQPYLLYELGPSREHRPEHRAWAGLVLSVDDPWWRTHYPPNGWGCKCRVRQISRREHERLTATGDYRTEAPPVERREWLNKRTGEVQQVPVGIDPGWDYNPGVARAARLEQALEQKASALGMAPTDQLGSIRHWADRFRDRPRTGADLARRARKAGIDPTLLTDTAALDQVIAYAELLKNSTFIDDIQRGGLGGSAVLVHELTELRALRDAGFDLSDAATRTRLVSEFTRAKTELSPELFPAHLAALRAELEYTQKKLAESGVSATLSEIARALYNHVDLAYLEPTIHELHAIGVPWPKEDARQELTDALSLPTVDR